MSEKPSRVRVKVVGTDYEVEVEFDASSVAQAIKDVQSALPFMKKALLPPESMVCPIHNVAMQKRSKEGKIWYSHRLENGAWCYGVEVKGG